MAERSGVYRRRQEVGFVVFLTLVVLLFMIIFVQNAMPYTVDSGTSLIFVAANDSSADAKSRADFVCDGSGDDREIQNALDALDDGGTVLLAEGTFNCSGVIKPRTGSTLKGSGSTQTFIRFTDGGLIRVKYEDVVLDGFHVSGSGYGGFVSDMGVIYINAGHVTVKNIVATADNTIQGVFYVRSIGLRNKNIEDIEFINDVADNPGTYGFLHSSWGTDYSVQKNIRYENCRAINCGRDSAFNPWVTGFDFAELNDIEGLEVNRCIAEGCLESGFHFEWGVNKTGCIFQDCVSRQNGLKPWPDDYNPLRGEYFASGYYLPGGQIAMYNCTAEANGAYGFFVMNPSWVHLRNCQDTETGPGSENRSLAKPVSFFIIQSNAPTADQSFSMENCTSINSHGAGLWISEVHNALIDNFTLLNPAGIDGKGALIGYPPDEGENYIGPFGGISSSFIDVSALSDDPEAILLYAYNNRNVIYSGNFTSPARHPVVIDGSETRDVVLKGLSINGGNESESSSGVMVTDAVAAGRVRISDGSEEPPIKL